MMQPVSLKKKIVDSAKPVAFRQISPVEMKAGKSGIANKKTAATLIIETPAPDKTFANERIEEYAGLEDHSSANEPKRSNANTLATGSKLSPLSKIRAQFKGNSSSTVNENQPLDQQLLMQAWKKFAVQLKEAKNSAAQSFDLAVLYIKDENSFEVSTANNIEQKFIDKERLHASSFLQQELNNRNIQFTIIINEQQEQKEPVEKILSSREQFLKMSEEYPLIKELKERLKLDLDY